ncbi:MAG: hypothetical protein WKF79_08815 [Nocardioides sp.]
MRREAAVAVVVASLMAPLAACSDDDDTPGMPRSVSPRAAMEDPVPVQRLLDVDPASLPVLQTKLPRRVPAEDAVLPSVLDDPPGRARMTYHPPEQFFAGPRGWASEDIMFYGRDGRWSRLRMADLGLPESAWFADTYGAGNLSPDGRWWAGSSRLGVILLDLSSGRWRILEVDGEMTQSGALWIPGEDAFIVMTYVGATDSGIRVSVPDGTLTRMPFVPFQVGIEPDGTPISLQNDGDGGARLIEWKDGQLVERFAVPRTAGPGRGKTPFAVLSTAGRFATTASQISDNYNSNTVTVVGSDAGEVQAVLRYQQRRASVEAYPGWLDEDTFLLKTRSHLLAWRPDDQQMYRVMDVPRTPQHHYWTVDVLPSSAVGVTVTSPDG